jgi:colanic acid/amylovoran biosynthesis glycosyltransferase
MLSSIGLTVPFRPMQDGRPAVSVVMPFLGSVEDARAALEALATLDRGPADEVIVADNSPEPVVETAAGANGFDGLRVVRADAERSPYYARNVGAEHARGEWILFVDADCRPAPTLLGDFFAEPVPDEVGALAGRIAPAAGQSEPLARWAASRGVLDQEHAMQLPGGPAAATANLLVRRRAWAEVGGFQEGTGLAGTDHELCWRVARAGWRIEYRGGAVVEHLHRETLREVLRQFAGYAAGDAWLNRRYPGGVPPRRSGRAFARAAAGAVGLGLTGRLERAWMKGVDALVAVAQAVGGLLGNAGPRGALPEPGSDRARRLVVASDRFPYLTAQFVNREIEALREAGWHVRVEAVERPERPLLGGARGIRVDYIEQEGTLDRARAMAGLAARHPLRCIADLARRRRFEPGDRMPLRALAPAALRLGAGGERHVHVHFAALAAANALRIGRIAGVPVSVTPHAQEVYLEPVSLPEKLRQATFTTTVCKYNVTLLERLVPNQAQKLHNIPIGVRPEAHFRRTPYPGGRTVVAVGRLVEQKGFVHLIDAVALLEDRAPVDRLLIAGDGPLRASLAARIAELGIGHRVELLGSLEPGPIRDLIERADLFAVPSVVAADGNRDAVPVVLYEAMAAAVPVVASDEVGLPENVDPSWGRLVAPGEPAALAGAIAELLELPPDRRAEMGEAGAEFIRRERNLAIQTSRLIALIEDAAGETA